ncbi:DUF1707 domain-containing protein [Aestuariimicrobium sp. p3-SID1156]|uniref:DUF1707 domain-containing protein n=1 Tax=Aestuariimicrobium sp. p3-SID1156 TaxID=2916038 RepID=UPI00223BF8C3|nr:DUF1707 domain-containing protein [Aestuariimicrobium sp. p3-SID1156]MCT1458885.1 DUF1707 domain-containing protein [Aestuariimicrobium sp. p3-SID1156]
MDSDTRIGFEERDDAVRRLQGHHAAGRLEMHEFEERMQSALQARTAGQVAALFDDLPDDGWIYGRTAAPLPVMKPTADLVTRVVEVPRTTGGFSSMVWVALPLILVLAAGIGFRLWPLFFVVVFGAPVMGGLRSAFRTDQQTITYERGDITSEVRALLGHGLKIQAIKRYREETGADLATAKYAVEQIERGS